MEPKQAEARQATLCCPTIVTPLAARSPSSHWMQKLYASHALERLSVAEDRQSNRSVPHVSQNFFYTRSQCGQQFGFEPRT